MCSGPSFATDVLPANGEPWARTTDRQRGHFDNNRTTVPTTVRTTVHREWAPASPSTGCLGHREGNRYANIFLAHRMPPRPPPTFGATESRVMEAV